MTNLVKVKLLLAKFQKKLIETNNKTIINQQEFTAG